MENPNMMFIFPKKVKHVNKNKGGLKPLEKNTKIEKLGSKKSFYLKKRKISQVLNRI